MVWCTVCEKSFYDTSNLRKHSQKFHPDKIDEIAPKKNNCVKAVCNDCGKYFSEYSSLTRHVKRFHSDKVNVITKPKAYNYECDTCGKHFTHLRSLTYHQRNHDLIESTEGTNKKRQNLKCCLCRSEENFEKDKILQHFEVVHDIKLFSDNLKFSGESEFYSWKGQIEIETKSYFINKHGTYATKTYLKKQFICHRSGTYKPEGSGARHLKVQGTNKINGYCPAEICLKVLRNGFCEVNFQTVHIGHSQDLGHLTLSKSERETVAAKIAAKIPFDTIIDEVRNESIAENKFERMHLLKKKDLYNIEQCFNLNNEAVRHAKDAVSVDAWVKEVEHTGCILLYKPQDTLSDTFTLLREEDFLLIIMNYGQEEMLVKYGSDCICIDGTHGLNGYEFELVTLLVLDDMREGFPSTFLISNRTDEVVMSVFFSVIENKLGKKLQPNIFMSDMAHSFYNAWMQVMGPVQYRLFCTWHVDRAWKKNLCKIKTKEKQVSIYKMLRTLLQERDENAFIQMCNNFMDILISDSDTYEFGTYFREYYLKNIQSWAYCYRVNCGINTNMHLERMHRTLKHIYLKGRVIKRLDKAINILMKFIRDKLFDRLIVMNKGKICSKIHALRSRHKTSETLDYKLVVKTETGFEVPSTSTNEIYLIQERQPSCTCKLICTECQICLHRYSCTCIDSCIKWNMCKHVHLIQRFLKNDSVNRQHVNTPGPAESDDNKLIISENLQTCEQEQNTLFEAIINGKEKKHMGELNSEKDKLKLYLMKLADDIETSEELTTVKKLIAPVEPTLAAMRTEKINMSFCSKILKRTPYNKQITQQRRLYKTKKAASKQSKNLLKPDDVENIAINLMYPPKHV